MFNIKSKGAAQVERVVLRDGFSKWPRRPFLLTFLAIATLRRKAIERLLVTVAIIMRPIPGLPNGPATGID